MNPNYTDWQLESQTRQLEALNRIYKHTNAQPIYKDQYICQYLGDSNQILWELPKGFAHAVITDPPYELGVQMMSWQEDTQQRNVFTDIHDANFGSGFDYNMLHVLNERLVRPNMLFFCNQKQISKYLRYQESKDLSLQILEWHKPNVFPTSNLWLFDTEFMIHMWKGVSLNGHKPIKTFFIEYPPNSGVSQEVKYPHPTAKSEKIMLKLIEQLTSENEIVLEPFSGSGTTAACCKKLKRKCIAIEINERYCMDSIERYKKTEAGVRQAEWI